MSLFVESNAAYEGENGALIGYQDYAPGAALTASSAQTGGEIANVTDGYTFDYWKPAATGTQTLTFDLGSAQSVDYVGIAAHNLSSELSGDVLVEYSDDDSSYTTAYTLDDADLTDDAQILIHMQARSHRYWRLSVPVDSTDLRIGVVMLGTLLQMQRNVYEGNAPPDLMRMDNTVPSMSETGNFIGQLVTRSFYEGSIQWQHLTPDWYRANFVPFIDATRTRPFFFAWRPSDYPDEVLFAWRTKNVQPSNDGPTGYMSVSLNMQGLIQ